MWHPGFIMQVIWNDQDSLIKFDLWFVLTVPMILQLFYIIPIWYKKMLGFLWMWCKNINLILEKSILISEGRSAYCLIHGVTHKFCRMINQHLISSSDSVIHSNKLAAFLWCSHWVLFLGLESLYLTIVKPFVFAM